MRVTWDGAGDHRYRSGVDRGMFYPDSGGVFAPGVAWNGLKGVEPKRTGRDKTPLYTKDVKTGCLFSSEDFGGSIKALTYPNEFEKCMGMTELIGGLYISQQERDIFGFSYRYMIGSDTGGSNLGYSIVLIYNAYITEITGSHDTISDSASLSEMSWDFDTFPIESDTYEPYSSITIDSTQFPDERIAALEDVLYGTEDTDPRLPSLEELIDILSVTYEEEDMSMWAGYPYETLWIGDDLYPIEPEPTIITPEPMPDAADLMEFRIDESGHLIYAPEEAVAVDFDIVDGHLVMEEEGGEG